MLPQITGSRSGLPTKVRTDLWTLNKLPYTVMVIATVRERAPEQFCCVRPSAQTQIIIVAISSNKKNWPSSSRRVYSPLSSLPF